MATKTHIPHEVDTAKAVEGAAQCWSCNNAIFASTHFCPLCGKIQPPVVMDHFSFFSTPRKLNIDGGLLEREFYKLSRKLHPDLYATASGREQEWSLEKSSQLNDAYRALRDPIARTQYLLGLEGVQLEEQSKAATDRARQTGEQKKQIVPADLLEEVFELNLQLQELRTSGEKDPEAIAQLRSAKKNFEGRQNEILARLKLAWDAWDAAISRGAAGDKEQRMKARDQMVELVNRHSYIRNLLRDVNAELQD